MADISQRWDRTELYYDGDGGHEDDEFKDGRPEIDLQKFIESELR